ncbi:MAG: leucine-rich repeat protein [Treponema sp.]|nr:leucine-rich repeat protein [Treponema sp.]
MCMRFELTPERLHQIEAKLQRRLRHPRPKGPALRNYLDDEDEPSHDELKYDDKGFCIEDGRLLRYNGDDDAVSIPEGVTEIGSRAFSYCTALASVTIPDSVAKIGYNAFEGCASLKSVTIPEGVTEIGSGAFLGCLALASASIPASVTSIGNGAFIVCKSLAEIRYEGTTEQWKAVEKGGDLNAGGPAQQVTCTDGNVELE